jgi:hypothetical protein
MPNPLGGQQQQPGAGGVLGVTNPFQGQPGASGNPAGLDNPGTNIKDSWRNQSFLNTLEQQQRMGLANNFSTAMFGAANPAANFFKQLSDVGSPYYQQQQRASFDQGVRQNNNAAGQARQQLSAAGYGYTPSGTTAATIGEMANAGSQNLESTFLQNLFQNEQMQLAGAQGLGQLAALFNPGSLMQYTSPQSTQGPSAASQFQEIASGLSSLFPKPQAGGGG